jgi:O-acetyl-ADP-ribose deacetylase (regulator of RNase III)
VSGSRSPRHDGQVRIEAVQGDITTRDVDVVVNAANSSLLGGGGVDGAIHAAAGPELLAACRELRRTTYPDGLPPGDAVATPGFRLPARWVVHTVGPNLHAGQDDPTVLASCFTRSLELAVEVGARSIAFPAVSAGVYGWDVAEVARIAVGAARLWEGGVDVGTREGHPAPEGLELVRFVLFSPPALAAFERALAPRKDTDG